jgi:hypothetical protein
MLFFVVVFVEILDITYTVYYAPTHQLDGKHAFRFQIEAHPVASQASNFSPPAYYMPINRKRATR